MEQLPRAADGLTIQSRENDPSREAIEEAHRKAFAEHFNFADPRTGDRDSYDNEGRYNCGRCRQVDGIRCALLAIASVDPQAGSCADWEQQPGEAAPIFRAKPPEMAAYGVAKNGVGFGCQRCPFASKAYQPDSAGRTLYCGKGDFRTFPDACCSINGAETMPSASQAQHNYFEWIDHTPGAAKKAGVAKNVAHEFVEADKGRNLKKLPKKKSPAKQARTFGALG